MIWLSIGLAAAGLWYAFSLGRLRPRFGVTGLRMGIIYPIWEAFLCCGMCIGLIVLFRETLDRQSLWGRRMAENQYAAYLFHVPVVVLAQLAVVGAPLSPFAKFAFVTAVAVPATFLLSALIRAPALARKVL
jgi:peptidoglycan/LPS O-acetylase OafA/YrhL